MQFQLIKEKIENEKKLTNYEYRLLKTKQKISWMWILSNPNAIDLLEEEIEYNNEIDMVIIYINPSIFIDEPIPIV